MKVSAKLSSTFLNQLCKYAKEIMFTFRKLKPKITKYIALNKHKTNSKKKLGYTPYLVL